MIHRALRLGGWVIDFLFAKLDYDKEAVRACLYEIGADDEIVAQVDRLMNSEMLNSGFTFANPDRRRALVAVGPASSNSEWLNTCVHEIHHLAVAIADSLGYDLEGESPAYLAGDATLALAKTICELGCSHCSD